MLMERDRDIMKFVENHGMITIKQCAQIFFKGNSRAYDLARRRLRKIEEMNKDIKAVVNIYTKEKMYCWNNKRVSLHYLYLYNFYAQLSDSNCKILEFAREPRWLDGKYRSDGFFKIVDMYGNIRILCVEVDVTHTTNLEKYEEIYHSKEIQNRYGGFPMIAIMGYKPIEYNGNLDVRFLDFKLSNFSTIFPTT